MDSLAPVRASSVADASHQSAPLLASEGDTEFAFLLARYASGLRLADLPAAAIAAAKTNIFDTLACAVAGSTAPAVREVVDLAAEWSGAQQATILAFGQKVPAHHAAWVNGTMAHARDYDDTHDAAVLHAGVTVVPAALAAAELRGGLGDPVSGADFIAGVAVGLEVVCRLGVATRIGIIESGFIYTPLFGHFGATVAAARVMALDEVQTINAIGIAYSQVAGNHQVTRDAAMTKRMQPGFAAQAALLSVQLAQRNIRGVQHTFDGVDGFLRVYLHGRCDPVALRDGLGSHYEFTELSYKPYPCCRFNHTAIDAALALRAAQKCDPATIRRIEVRTNRQAYEAVCTPVDMRKSPKTIVQAQFSIPYAVAVALTDGHVGLAHFTEQGLQRADILELAARVEGVVSSDIERDWSRNISPAHVLIEMVGGAVHEMRVDYPSGHPRQPMSAADFDRKMDDCVGFSATRLPADARQRLRRTVDDLETAPDATVLLRALVPNA